MSAIGHVAAALQRAAGIAGESAPRAAGSEWESGAAVRGYPELPPGRLEQFASEPAPAVTVCAGAPRPAFPHAEHLAVPGGLPDATAEQYRKIVAALYQARRARDIRVLMVTSAVAGEGKTVTAANVALTLSGAFRRRVLLVDADLRRPMLHEIFGAPSVPGLIDALRSSAGTAAASPIVPLSAGLWLLPAGRPERDGLGQLASPALRALLADAAAHYDWVVVDTPPAMLLSDTTLLADVVDATLLVVRADATQYAVVSRAIDLIGRERIVGAVLNRAEDAAVRAAYGGDYYEHYASRARRDSPQALAGTDEPPGQGHE